jgi:hypothetical protein
MPPWLGSSLLITEHITESSQQSLGSARNASARGSTGLASSRGFDPDSRCTMGRSPGNKERSKEESGGGVDGDGGVDCGTRTCGCVRDGAEMRDEVGGVLVALLVALLAAVGLSPIGRGGISRIGRCQLLCCAGLARQALPPCDLSSHGPHPSPSSTCPGFPRDASPPPWVDVGRIQAYPQK